MFEDLAPKMAKVITEYSTQIKPGDLVALTCSTLGAPLVEAMYEAVLECGVNPLVMLNQPGLGELFYRIASDEQLEFVNPVFETVAHNADVYMVLDAAANTKSMTGVDPAKMIKSQQANQKVYEVFYGRINSGDLRYMYTLWPTHASAQQAEMGLLAYTEFVYKACALDQADPVAYWSVFRDRQTRLADWLKGKKHAEVRGPGIDLTFDFGDRSWVSCHGELNFPDGEIYTCPVEESVNGHVAFSYPSIYNGTEVSGIRLTFKEGKAIEASADKGEQHLLAQLDLDAGARFLGEFAIGTNTFVQQYTGNTLFDEKIGGTIHMALGNAVPDAGGKNQSMVHWDIVHGMQNGGEILIDGDVFYRSGQFMVE